MEETEAEKARSEEKLLDKKKDMKHWRGILAKLKEFESIEEEINKCLVKAAWCSVIEKAAEVRPSPPHSHSPFPILILIPDRWRS